jgi:hypothetical protein
MEPYVVVPAFDEKGVFSHEGEEFMYVLEGTHEFVYSPNTGVSGEWWVWANYTGNCTSNCTINPNRYFDLMGVLTFDNGQFFLLLFVTLWLLFVFKYLDNRYSPVSGILAMLQLGLCFPLTVVISLTSYFMSLPFGYVFAFLVPITSFYLLGDFLIYKKKSRK